MSTEWKAQLAQALAHAAGVDEQTALRSLEAPKQPIADWSSTLAFTQAKALKANPAKLAAEWAQKAVWPRFIQKAEAAGPYLNFHFSPTFWANLLDESLRPQDEAEKTTGGGKVLIEFPSVNPNKPWHVGHLRNALLGDSLARLLEYAGHTVERQDYIDDLGLQVAQSVWGRQHMGEPQAPAGAERWMGKLDHMLGWQYVDVAKKVADPVVEAQVRHLLKILEEGESKEASAARKVVEECVKAQYQTAFSYGIRHDALVFESDIVRTLFAEGLERLKASSAVKVETQGKNAGCLVVPLAGEEGFEGMENADKILIRSDGTATYTGKDVVFQMWKFGLLQGRFRYAPFIQQPDGTTAYMTTHLDGQPMPFGTASAVINVIGAEQAYPQKVISAAFRKMGLVPQAERSIHLAYEHVVLPEGRFSGRQGTWMAQSGGPGFTADDLLAEVRTEAETRIRGEHAPDERKSIAADVSVGAIRFSFLRTTANQKITFDYERALSMEGDSGPYIMYAYARACAILRKGQEAGLTPSLDGAESYSYSESEVALLRLLLRWPEAVRAAADKFQVHPIADFAIEAAGRFNQFYTTTPVLSDEAAGRKALRLAEVAAARELLGQAMDILGVPRREKM